MDISAQKYLVDFVIFLISLGTCALFAFMETSVTAIKLFKIKELEDKSSKYKGFLETLEHRPQLILITILIATNMATIITAVLLQNIIENLFSDLNLPPGIGFSVGIAIGSIIVTIIGEVIPKSMAQSKSEGLSSLLWIAKLMYQVFSPVCKPLVFITEYFTKSNKKDDQMSEKELHFLVNYMGKQGIMEPDKINMLQNIFRMGDTHVKEILIPNSSIINVSVDSTTEEILNLFENYRYSRFPVFEKNTENIIGIIYQKDLFLSLQLNKNKARLKDLIKPIIFVPDSLKVSELLKEFKRKSIHMGMVLDEYGSVTGLVTLEDALEEIVGDITDEHDHNQNSDKIKVIKNNQEWLVNATADLDRLEDFLQAIFEVETAVTIGGFLTEQAQRLPEKNEQIFYKGFCFTIEKANKKRIIQVRITRKTKESSCLTESKDKKKK